MKYRSFLLLTTSLFVSSSLPFSSALADEVTWTGGSSRYQLGPCTGGRCPVSGNNSWGNQQNWAGGVPTAGDNVNIGLSTNQNWLLDVIPRPVQHDTVVITNGTNAAANRVKIGFSGSRTTSGGTGEGKLINEGALRVGDDVIVGDSGAGTFTNRGTTTIDDNLIIGRDGSGTVINDAGAELIVGDDIIVGDEDTGTFTNSGETTVGDNLIIGRDDNGTVINNAGAEITVGNNVVVGDEDEGTLTNNGKLNVTGGDLVIGRNDTGDVTNGPDGGITVGKNLVVGQSADGRLISRSDISVGGNTSIGQIGTGSGAVGLENGSDLVTKGTLTVGENGKGHLAIGADSTAETTGRVAAGLSSTSQDNKIDVAGRMLNHSYMTIGDAGSATVNINPKGLVETDKRVTLGLRADAQGTVINDGTMINRDRLTVGDEGYGHLVTKGPNATTTTSGDVIVGNHDQGGIGLVEVNNGGTMNNARSLTVGAEGEGYLLVTKGGKVNNGIGTIARDKGSLGYAYVGGGDSLWDNRTSLTLAGEEGAHGVLVINDGATVRVADGEGTLVIAAEKGSKGILNIGAMSPVGDDYGLDPNAQDALGDTDTDSDARAAGTVDAAFIQFGEGAGTVNFKHTEEESDDYRFKPGFVGNGTVNHYAGFTVLDGDSSALTGPVNVEGGTLVANNVLGGNIAVGSEGTLRIGHGGETGDVVNDIANDGLVEFNRSNTYVFGKIISGAGDVAQIGSGTTVITGENTYTGATTITDGTLQIGDGGTTGSINATSGVAIGTEGTLAFNRSDAVTWDRALSGTGTIRQIGSGTTRIVNDNAAFTGSTFVEAGVLAVDGTLGGTVDVNDGSTLTGIGQVGTTVVHGGGTVAPGNGIGKLTVAGNLTQEAGSTYQAEVLSNGESDLLAVTGAANIAEGSVLNVSKLDSTRYDLDYRYKVLTADQGVSGTYTLSGDTSVSAFYRLEDQYDANNAYLKVNQFRQFDEAGRTPNQIAAARAAQELKYPLEITPGYETGGRPTNELFRAIAYLPDDKSAQHAFDQISGEIYASTEAGLLEDSRFVREAASKRIRDAFSEEYGAGEPRGIKDPVPVYDTAIWGRGYGSWSTTDGHGNASDLDRSIGGVIGGIDTALNEYLRVGVLAGYSRSTFSADDRNSEAKSNNIDLGIYGGGKWRNIGLTLGANYTWHDVSVERSPSFLGFSEKLDSDFDANTFQVYGDVSYTFDLSGSKLEPFAGLAYVKLDRDGYRETGGVAALTGGDGDIDATYGTLGIRGSTDFNLGGLQTKANGMIGWRHAFDDVTPTVSHAFNGSSNFTVSGVPLAQDVAIVEVGFTTSLSETLDLGVSYNGQFGSRVQDHGVRGDLSWKF